MKRSNKRWCVLTAGASVFKLVNAPSLLAQGCAMCKTAAAAQSKEAMAALNWGILLLLVPPVAIMSGLLLFAFRCRNAPRPTQEADESGRDEEVTSSAA